VNLLARMQCWPFAFNAQLLAPQRAQVRLTLRVRRRSLLNGCGRGAGEERRGLTAAARSACSVASVASAAAHVRPRLGSAAKQEQRQMDLN
jgi:hypothetical protein